MGHFMKSAALACALLIGQSAFAVSMNMGDPNALRGKKTPFCKAMTQTLEPQKDKKERRDDDRPIRTASDRNAKST